MAVVIRMKRTGRRNAPCYRISVADSRSPRDGRTLETLGVYDPISPREELRTSLKVERARHWLLRGALPSETVRSIFKRFGVYDETIPTHGPRSREGRKRATQTRARREQAKAARAQAKATRRSARQGERRAAAKAAAGAGS